METTLFLSILFGSVGVGYFIYGRKQKRVVPLLAGMGLCGFPYFVSGTLAVVIIGVVLTALPWILRD
jgi:hypothetical protein